MYALLLLAPLLSAQADRPVPIQRVWADPDEYEGRTLALTGWAWVAAEGNLATVFFKHDGTVIARAAVHPAAVADAAAKGRGTRYERPAKVVITGTVVGTRGGDRLHVKDARVVSVQPPD